MSPLKSTLVLSLALASIAVPKPALGQVVDQSGQGQTRPRPAAPTAAQKPAAPKVPIGVRAAFVVDSTAMHASQTYQALTGSSRFTGFGGEVDVLNLWRKMYVRAGFSSASRNGERAFLLLGEDPISTGVPITISTKLIEVSAGIRREFHKHPKYEVYGGGGLLFTRYSEKNSFAEPADNVSEAFRGFVGHAGLEYSLTKNRKWVAGFEGQFRSVANALGKTGLSKSFNESNLGGVTVRGLVGYRLRRK